MFQFCVSAVPEGLDERLDKVVSKAASTVFQLNIASVEQRIRLGDQDRLGRMLHALQAEFSPVARAYAARAARGLVSMQQECTLARHDLNRAKGEERIIRARIFRLLDNRRIEERIAVAAAITKDWAPEIRTFIRGLVAFCEEANAVIARDQQVAA